jgi:hypothetical protein
MKGRTLADLIVPAKNIIWLENTRVGGELLKSWDSGASGFDTVPGNAR